MNIKKSILNKIRTTAKRLQPILLPTQYQQQQKWKAEEERIDRYNKYIPNYVKSEIIAYISCCILALFVFFMTFGISLNSNIDELKYEQREIYKKTLKETHDFDIAEQVAKEYVEQHPVKYNEQTKAIWDTIMKPLGLEQSVVVNSILLFFGVCAGISPALTLYHRRKIVDNMHENKLEKIKPNDETDKQIIYDMAKDNNSYFYHIAFNSTNPKHKNKYTLLIKPIIDGHLAGHPEDKGKAMLILKRFQEYNNTK